MSDCFNVYEIPGCYKIGAYLPARPAMPFGRVPIRTGQHPDPRLNYLVSFIAQNVSFSLASIELLLLCIFPDCPNAQGKGLFKLDLYLSIIVLTGHSITGNYVYSKSIINTL
jgi:hypothetical protein